MPLVHALASPNVAYLLFITGCYGLLVEFFHPGGIFPGLSGGICLALAILAFSVLPMHPVGAVLLVAAIGLFVLDAYVAGHGGFTLIGAAAFLAGSLLLYGGTGGGSRGAVALPLALGITAAATVLGAIIIRAAVSIRGMPPLSDTRLLLGTTGIVASPLQPLGTVRVGGALWSARLCVGAQGPRQRFRSAAVSGLAAVVPGGHDLPWLGQRGTGVLPGQEVRIVGRRGLILEVEPLDEEATPSLPAPGWPQ